jgi:hypothetical protein
MKRIKGCLLCDYILEYTVTKCFDIIYKMVIKYKQGITFQYRTKF